MAVTEEVTTAECTIYDDTGRTVLPEDIREKLDVSKGDKVKYIYDGESVTVVKLSD